MCPNSAAVEKSDYLQYIPHHMNNQSIVVSDVSTAIVTAAKGFAKRHKVITFSYLYGVFILGAIMLIGSGTKLTFDQQRQYDMIMSSIDLQAEYTAQSKYHTAYANYNQAKGWFSCDSHCQHYKSIMDRRKNEWDEIKAEGNARMSDAKSVAGLFSEVGVNEVKDSFWDYFHSGKQFAKRQSWWDAMFMGMRSMSRDESFIEYGLKMLMQVLINFSMGLIMALFVFIFGLWGIISTYQANPLTALLFFVSASSAAFAFVSTYLFAIYGAAAGGVVGVVKMAESNMRIEAARGGGGARVRNGYLDRNRNRPHYQ